MLVSVCIPMYNESSVVEQTLLRLEEELNRSFLEQGIEYEVILANDGSLDGCERIAQSVIDSRSLTRFRMVGYPVNRGKGSAVRCAIADSSGDILVCTDCDLAFGTEVIPKVVREFDEGIDIVIGSRTLTKDGFKDYSLIRKAASRAYRMLLRVLTGYKGSDSQCGFKAYRGDVGRKVFSLCQCDGYAFDQEVLMIAKKLGYVIREFPVVVLHHGESKVRLVRDTLKMLKEIRSIKKHVKEISV